MEVAVDSAKLSPFGDSLRKGRIVSLLERSASIGLALVLLLSAGFGVFAAHGASEGPRSCGGAEQNCKPRARQAQRAASRSLLMIGAILRKNASRRPGRIDAQKFYVD